MLISALSTERQSRSADRLWWIPRNTLSCPRQRVLADAVALLRAILMLRCDQSELSPSVDAHFDDELGTEPLAQKTFLMHLASCRTLHGEALAES